jgi:hypothetical protein
MPIRGVPSIEAFRTLPHFSCFASGNSGNLVANTFLAAPLDTFDMNNGGFASVSGNVVTVSLGGMWLFNWGINFGTNTDDGAQYLGNVRQNATTVTNGTLLQQLGTYPGAGASVAGGILQVGSVIPPTFLAPGDTVRLQGRVQTITATPQNIRGNAAIGVSNTFIAGVYLGPTM